MFRIVKRSILKRLREQLNASLARQLNQDDTIDQLHMTIRELKEERDQKQNRISELICEVDALHKFNGEFATMVKPKIDLMYSNWNESGGAKYPGVS